MSRSSRFRRNNNESVVVTLGEVIDEVRREVPEGSESDRLVAVIIRDMFARGLVSFVRDEPSLAA